MERVYVVESTNLVGVGDCVEAVYGDPELAMDHVKRVLGSIARSKGLVNAGCDCRVMVHQVRYEPAWETDPKTGLVLTP